MKKILLLLVFSAMMFSCKSKEEKALALVDKYMFENLLDYESYEKIEVAVDSAFTSIFRDSTIRAKALSVVAVKELASEALEKAENATGYAEIYAGVSYYSGQRKYREYMDEATKELEKALKYIDVGKEADSTICALAKDYPRDFEGWFVKHRFRSKNRGGNYTVGNYIFVMDKDFKKIIFQADADGEVFNKVNDAINEAVSKK